MVTATADVNGDLDEEVIAGTPVRAGSPASVSVYDGDKLKLLDRSRSFPESPNAGLSVATGDIERDGRAEIVVSRVGPGGSLVRIFRRNGAVVRTIGGTLSGALLSGVTVTSSDYDDVAGGAGRVPAHHGRRPRRVHARRALASEAGDPVLVPGRRGAPPRASTSPAATTTRERAPACSPT